eukprot:CAMPEP_0170389422 /NCGR_PEP_ID=MMETSP0117_2-20130122/18610_1 /TAXON_ID=400756 /ORGANISM="Durinskia baltica, Strain CSIRO CS-38" /LENGTH=359 /DNA_ID=CAMNT_0010645411 /DNA_START=131 /DNA_END=1208 /DNA_ORIENTATION=-
MHPRNGCWLQELRSLQVHECRRGSWALLGARTAHDCLSSQLETTATPPVEHDQQGGCHAEAGVARPRCAKFLNSLQGTSYLGAPRPTAGSGSAPRRSDTRASRPLKVGRGCPDADLDLLAQLGGGPPSLAGLVEHPPILVAELEGHFLRGAGLQVELHEAAQLPEHRPQAPEPDVKLWHGRALPLACVLHRQGDLSARTIRIARGTEARELEVGVSEAEAECEGGGLLHRVVPAVADEDALGHFAFEIDAGVLRLRESVFAGLRECQRESAAGARFAGDELGEGWAGLLPGHEHDERCIYLVDPVGLDRARNYGNHDHLLLGVCRARCVDHVLSAGHLQGGPVLALLVVRGRADHDNIG